MEAHLMDRTEAGLAHDVQWAAVIVAAFALPAFAVAGLSRDESATLRSKASVHALVREMSLVAQGRLPLDRADQSNRPFAGEEGTTGRHIRVSGDVRHGSLEVAVGPFLRAECSEFGSYLTGGHGHGGVIASLSVNNSTSMDGKSFSSSACIPDGVARGRSGIPLNTMHLRFDVRATS
jgi:hypothetical protein